MGNEIIENITKYYGYSYMIPIVCIFGILCNIVNLTVLASPRLKESPYTYLTSLAWSDLLTLAFTLTLSFTRGCWFQDFNIEFILKKLEKKFFLPSANLFSAFSVTITVALTLERYFYIKFPIHATNFYTSKYTKRIILCILFFIIVFRTPMYFFFDVVKSVSIEQRSFNDTTLIYTNQSVTKITNFFKFEKFHKTYFFLSFLIFEIIPFLILSTLNLSLVLMIKRANKEIAKNISNDIKFTTRLNTNRSNNNNSSNNNNNNNHSNIYSFNNKIISKIKKSIHESSLDSEDCNLVMRTKISYKKNSHLRKRKEIKLTRTLIAVVFFVLLSEICSIITYDKITEFLIGSYYPNYMKSYYNLQVFISNLIVLIVHSVNFFLYCFFNEKYFAIFKQKYYFKLSFNREFKVANL